MDSSECYFHTPHLSTRVGNLLMVDSAIEKFILKKKRIEIDSIVIDCSCSCAMHRFWIEWSVQNDCYITVSERKRESHHMNMKFSIYIHWLSMQIEHIIMCHSALFSRDIAEKSAFTIYTYSVHWEFIGMPFCLWPTIEMVHVGFWERFSCDLSQLGDLQWFWNQKRIKDQNQVQRTL